MAGKCDTDKLTESVKQLAKHEGAVLVGVAPIERFDPMPPLYDAPPRGHHPRDFVPDARSVISIAMPILNPVKEATAVLADVDMEMIPPSIKYNYLEALYHHLAHKVHDFMLDFIGQAVGQHLLSQGYQTMSFPTAGLPVSAP